MWGQTVCRVWLPNQDAVVLIPRSALQPLNAKLTPGIEAHRITYIAAAAKVAEVLEGGASAFDGPELLAPMESNVIPLPHQSTKVFALEGCQSDTVITGGVVGVAGGAVGGAAVIREDNESSSPSFCTKHFRFKLWGITVQQGANQQVGALLLFALN